MRLQRHSSQIVAALLVVSATASPCLGLALSFQPPTQEDAYLATGEGGTEALRQADALRLKTMKSINTLLGKKPGAAQEFELLRRLAELHVERHDYLYQREVASYDKKNTAFEKSGSQGRPPQMDHHPSQGELKKAAGTYRKIVRRFPSHPHIDRILYETAKTLARLGSDNALIYFRRLTSQHSSSPLVCDAFIALGDFHFDRHEIAQAKEAYKRALSFKSHRLYPYAVFKLGWSHYNSDVKTKGDNKQNLQKALASFKLVVLLSDPKQGEERTSVGRIHLRDEALKDLIMVFADLGQVDEAWEYFHGLDHDDSFYRMLRRLGNNLIEQGKAPEAIAVFERLLRERQTVEDAPTIHVQIVELHHASQSPDKVVAGLTRAMTLFSAESAWFQAYEKNADRIQEAREVIRRSIHRMAALFHRDGMKLKSHDLLGIAEKIYTLHRDGFPQHELTGDILYFTAEIQYELKKYIEAGRHYTDVARITGHSRRIDASLNAIVSFNQAVSTDEAPELPKPGQAPQPIPLSESRQLLVEAIDLYEKLAPQAQNLAQVTYAAAKLKFDFGDYRDATDRFKRLIMRQPKSAQSESAAALMFDYHGNRQDWPKVVVLAGWLQGHKISSALKDEADRRVRQALFQLALATERGGDYRQASEQFADFQKRFPNAPIASKALYNAIMNAYRANQARRALKLSNLFLKQYPKAHLRCDVSLESAKTYEVVADFPRAASSYRGFSQRCPDDQRAPKALFNAAVILRSLERFKKATEAYREVYTQFVGSKPARDARIAEAELWLEQRQWSKARKAWRGIREDRSFNKLDRAVAEAKEGLCEIRAAQRDRGWRRIQRAREKVRGQSGSRAAEVAQIAAQVAFDDLKDRFQKFSSAPLRGAIERAVKDRQKQLERLSKDYQKVIEIGDAEFAVASLFQLGSLHEGFARMLVTAAESKSGGDAFAVQSQLEQVAEPLRQQALEYFKAAFDRSNEVQVLSEWTKKTYRKMAELAPGEYRPIRERVMDPLMMVHHQI